MATGITNHRERGRLVDVVIRLERDATTDGIVRDGASIGLDTSSRLI